MRTIVDIPESQIKILNHLSSKQKVSRAEIIREALKNYIAQHTKIKKSYKLAFGIWNDKTMDSLSYQQELRDEWSK